MSHILSYTAPTFLQKLTCTARSCSRQSQTSGVTSIQPKTPFRHQQMAHIICFGSYRLCSVTDSRRNTYKEESRGPRAEPCRTVTTSGERRSPIVTECSAGSGGVVDAYTVRAAVVCRIVQQNKPSLWDLGINRYHQVIENLHSDHRGRVQKPDWNFFF